MVHGPCKLFLNTSARMEILALPKSIAARCAGVMAYWELSNVPVSPVPITALQSVVLRFMVAVSFLLPAAA